MGAKLYLFEKLAFFFSPVLFKSFSDFFSGTFFHANYFSIFSMVRFFYGKKNDQSCRGRRSRRQVSVAVADFGRRLLLILSRSLKSAKKLSRSPISAAGYFFVCRGRRSRRQKSVAVADFGRRLFFNLSRSPKSATNFCRGRRLRSR